MKIRSKRPKRRVRKIIGWFAVALVVLVAVLLASLLLLDLTVYRGPLQSGVSAFLDRSVRFEGEMSLTPSLWPTIVVEDVHIANPEWASRPNFVSAERLEFQVALLPLMTGELRVLGIALVGTDILLETTADGRNNWTFRERRERSKPRELPDIQSLTWERSLLGFRSRAGRVYRLTLSKGNAVLTEGERIKIKAAGTYQDVPFTLSLLGGRPDDLVSLTPWPVELNARAAGATLGVDGTVSQPLAGKGFDLNLTVKGEQLEALSSLLNVTLPALGAYGLSAHVTDADNRYHITNVTGHLDGADAVKRLTLTQGTASVSFDASSELRLAGTYADVPFTLSLMSGSLTELTEPDEPWPINLNAHAAGATLRVDGIVSKPISEGLDLAVSVDGKQFKKLTPLVDTDLPALGRYELSGRVRGQQTSYTITDLSGRIGDAGAPVQGVIAKGKIALPRGEPVTLDLEGAYKNTRFSISLIGGLLAELTEPSKPWPIQAVVTGAGATLNAAGTIKRPIKGDGFDLKFDIKGKRVKALEPVVGVALPALGPYKLSGRALDTDTGYRVTNLTARLDRTDISGTLDLAIKGPRRLLTAKLASKTVDIGRLIKADEKTTTNGDKPAFLDLPVPVDMLRMIDVRLDLAINQVRGGRVPISDLSVVATLENGKLDLTPLRVALPGTRIQGRLQLDARTANPLLTVRLSTDRIDIGKIVDTLVDDGRLSGTAGNMSLNLSASGATLEALLKNADSELVLQAVDAGYAVADSGAVIPIKISKAVATTSTGGPINLLVDGMFRKSPFSLATSGDRLVKLVASQEAWSMTVTARIGGATVDAKGVVTRPFAEQDLDFQFTLGGADLDMLDPVLNIDMPTIGPYRLVGRLAERAGVFRLAELEISLEDNHATGKLRITTTGPRPHIVASLEADKLHLEDLFEEIEEYAEKKKVAKKEDITKAEDGRVIPDVAVPVKLLRSVDLDVDLNVTDLFVGRTDLGDVVVKAKLENGRLILSPFKGKLAGGELSIELDVDTTEDTPVVSFQLSGQQIDYGALLKAFEVTDLVESVLDVEIDLSGRGATSRGLLEHANGLIVLISGPGTIGRGGLDLWGANLLAGIMRGAAGALKTKEETKLNCMVWPFDINDGVAQSEAILIDMSRTSVGGTGSINFGTEELDLLLKPARKRRTFLSVGPPVRVAGTLSSFDFRIEGKKRLFGRLLLPFINPAFLLVTTEAGTGERNPCVAAIAGEGVPGETPEERRGLVRRFLEQFKPSEGPSGAQSGVER